MSERHSLLRRQLRRYVPPELLESGTLDAFLASIDDAYRASDADRALLERAMDISSDELRAANTELRAALSALPERVLLVDTDTCITDVKSTALPELGLDVDVDLRTTRLGTPEIHAAVRAALTGETPQPLALRLDEEHSLLVHARPCGPDKAAVIVHDTTSQLLAERATAELEASERATRLKTEFLAAMSHEIRTPMNAVIGMTSLLSRSSLEPQQREMVDTIRTSGQSLVALINDILDFSKIEAGSLDVERTSFSPGALAEDTVELLTPKAAAKGIELEALVELPSEQALESDPSRLRQVLVNLVDNAVKFTSGGHVILHVGFDPDCRGLRFAVEDTGIGIAPESIEKILRPFEQADGSITRNFGGTGLGLSISERLISLMGGTLTVNSAPGKGSTFAFTLPLNRGAADHDAPARGTAMYTAHGALRARSIGSQLRRLGYIPALVHIDELRGKVTGRGPEAIVLDISATSGTELQRVTEIAAEAERIGCPIVCVTAPDGGPPPKVLEDGDVCVARFPLRLRNLADALLPAEEGRSGRQGPGQLQPIDAQLTALIVEDNPVNQLVTRRMLERLEIDYEIAGHGEAALEAMARRPFDLVLMDCQMPVMDGYSATRAIRQRERDGARPTPIIAMTANALFDERERCEAAGMNDYLPKPFDIEQLRAVIARNRVTRGVL